ncbi:hypothetical protein C8250_042795 [Streptomyces sp. So13.3]|uniref:hypothetical protein n=1 Tax=unclassified Streptomyces TaxID=2593676 RepID=UPI001105CD26|nr:MULTISPECIES: hypothetical protein [unclassified Streptomyces]MCZ4102319.1 hypothetical protein [Streptomyces sp. H39-C1]QNA77602.1 hypothetical protein C8250_042795 [Streptomyces sp. So13.3]
MATADRELLSRPARNAVRGLMSDLVAGAIGEYWENEHFTQDPDFTPGDGGVRKQLFDSYAASVDWTDDDQVTRALRVFESMLRRLDRESRKYGGNGLPADTVADLREAFARDGCHLDDELRLHTARVAHLTVHADALTEASGGILQRGRKTHARHPGHQV